MIGVFIPDYRKAQESIQECMNGEMLQSIFRKDKDIIKILIWKSMKYMIAGRSKSVFSAR